VIKIEKVTFVTADDIRSAPMTIEQFKKIYFQHPTNLRHIRKAVRMLSPAKTMCDPFKVTKIPIRDYVLSSVEIQSIDGEDVSRGEICNFIYTEEYWEQHDQD
jgi:hypothetical protein